MKRLLLVLLLVLPLPASHAAAPPPPGSIHATVEPFVPEVSLALAAPASHRAGAAFHAVASVTNTGSRTLSVTLGLLVPVGLSGGTDQSTVSLRPRGTRATTWTLCSVLAGQYVLVATASYAAPSERTVSVDSPAQVVVITAVRRAACG